MTISGEASRGEVRLGVARQGTARRGEGITQAGRLVGIADFRPTFGRFAIVKWEVGLS